MSERDYLLVLTWLVGLHDEKPSDADEQWPLAWQAARAAIKNGVAGKAANDGA